MVHLVLFTLPDSQPRLDRLETRWPALTQAGARVRAVPMRDDVASARIVGLRSAPHPGGGRRKPGDTGRVHALPADGHG